VDGAAEPAIQCEIRDGSERNPLIGIRQPFRLWSLTRRLRLRAPSAARVFFAYYSGRRRLLRRMAPETMVIDIPGWGKVPIRPNGQDHILLTQIFVHEEYRLRADKVRRIVDLGANIGMATVYLNRLFPEAEIACVEPSPQNTPLLKQAIALNRIRASVFEAAIGPTEGSVDLFLSSEPYCTSVVNAINSVGVVRVPQVSMRHVMRQMGWDDIDLLKIDIEGAERSVLTENNSWLDKVRMVIGESHVDVGYSYAQLQRDLGEHGFVLETVIEETDTYGATFRGTNARAPVAPA
jgi:FkbM family methyltransferase